MSTLGWMVLVDYDKLTAIVPLLPATEVKHTPIELAVETGKLVGHAHVDGTDTGDFYMIVEGTLTNCWETTDFYDWPNIFRPLAKRFGVEYSTDEYKPKPSNSFSDLAWKTTPELLRLRGSHGCPADLTWGQMLKEIFRHAHILPRKGATNNDYAWIVRCLLRGTSFWEDLPTLEGLLQSFHARNGELPRQWRDLRDVDSFSRLRVVLREAFNPPASNAGGYTAEDLATYSNHPYAVTMWDDANLRVVKLLEFEGSQWWSWLWQPRPKPGDTNSTILPSWCTGWDDPHNWNLYTGQGPLYVVLDKTGVLFGKPAKWEIHLESDQFKDSDDLEVDRNTFVQPPFMHAMDQSGLLENSGNFFHDVGDYKIAVKLATLVSGSSAQLVAFMQEQISKKYGSKRPHALNGQWYGQHWLPHNYVTKFWVLAVKRQLPNPLVTWLWLLATGNRYAPIAMTNVSVGDVHGYLRANVVMRHETAILRDFAVAAAHTGTSDILAGTVTAPMLTREAATLKPIERKRGKLVGEQRASYKLLITSLLGKQTAEYLNSLWTSGSLLSVVLAMTKAEFDKFYHSLNQVAPAKLVFKPTQVLPTAHQRSGMVLPPGEWGHKEHYLMFCLTNNRTANVATFVSKVRSLSPDGYDWLLLALANWNVATDLETLGLALAQRATPNVGNLMNRLVDGPSLTSLVRVYNNDWTALVPLLATAAVVAGPTGTSSQLWGGDECNFWQELALAIGYANTTVEFGVGQHATKVAAMFDKILTELSPVVKATPLSDEIALKYARASLDGQTEYAYDKIGFVRELVQTAVAQVPPDRDKLLAAVLLPNYFKQVWQPSTPTGRGIVALDLWQRSQQATTLLERKATAGDTTSAWQVLDSLVNCYAVDKLEISLDLWGTQVVWSAADPRWSARLGLCCLRNSPASEYLQVASDFTTGRTQVDHVLNVVIPYLLATVKRERVLGYLMWIWLADFGRDYFRNTAPLLQFVRSGVVSKRLQSRVGAVSFGSGIIHALVNALGSLVSTDRSHVGVWATSWLELVAFLYRFCATSHKQRFVADAFHVGGRMRSLPEFVANCADATEFDLWLNAYQTNFNRS